MSAPRAAFGGNSAESMMRFFEPAAARDFEDPVFEYRVEEREALHNVLPDCHVWLHFDQADAHLVVSLQLGYTALEELRVRGQETLERFDLPFALTAEDVERTLGPHVPMEDGSRRYDLCSDSGCSHLTVTVEDGDVVAIAWDWWID